MWKQRTCSRASDVFWPICAARSSGGLERGGGRAARERGEICEAREGCACCERPPIELTMIPGASFCGRKEGAD